jgi:hypothetical protein
LFGVGWTLFMKPGDCIKRIQLAFMGVQWTHFVKTATGLKITFMYSWDLLTSFVSPWKVCYGLHNFHGSILTRRARCTGHALSMPEMRNMYRVLEVKSEGKN